MTRDEAIQIYQKRLATSYESAGKSVDTLVDLGILKLDEPMTATERALTAINEYAKHDGIYIDVFPNGTELIELLNEAGVRIVDK